jgi:hypothetical protein
MLEGHDNDVDDDSNIVVTPDPTLEREELWKLFSRKLFQSCTYRLLVNRLLFEAYLYLFSLLILFNFVIRYRNATMKKVPSTIVQFNAFYKWVIDN